MNFILSLTYSPKFEPPPLKMVFPYDILPFLQMRLNFKNSNSIFLRKSFTNRIRVQEDFLTKTESEFLRFNRIYRKGKMSHGKPTTTLGGANLREYVNEKIKFISSINFLQSPESTGVRKHLLSYNSAYKRIKKKFKKKRKIEPLNLKNIQNQ